MPAAAVGEANGARTTAESDFALYELGRAGAIVHPAPARSLSITSMPLPNAVRRTRSDISIPCGATGEAPLRVLGARATISRRALWPLIADAECRYGLPSGLMDSVVLAESRYDPFVVSPAGAVGLSQLMPATANDLGVIDPFDPQASAQAGARYLRQLLDSFGGNVSLALAAYNAGPAAVRRVRGIPVNGETPAYVRRVLAYWTAPGVGPMGALVSARQTAQMLGFGPTITNCGKQRNRRRSQA